MGTVYRVHHKFIHKDLALKMLNPQLSSTEQVVQRFEREAMASARIEHPNVCQVTDSGRTPDGQLYIVMELLEGSSLQKIVGEEAPLSVSRIINISRQICSALAKAHDMKIIHRDLKPENVMVIRAEDGSEVIKIMDFGIAKVTLDDVPTTQLTTAGMVFGTPHYISPEQATGDPVDGRSDLYSLGCIIYEMATADRPFEADTVGMLLRKHVTSEVPEIVQDGGSGPVKLKRLSGLVRRLMAKNPDERPSTARDVSNHLDKIERDEIPDDSIATAATMIVEKGEAEVARLASYTKGVASSMFRLTRDIVSSLFTLRTKRARSRAETLFESVLIPVGLRIVAAMRRSPLLLGLWMLAVIVLLGGASAGIVALAKISLGGEDEAAPLAVEPKASDIFTVNVFGDQKMGKKGGKKDKGGEEIKDDVAAEIENAIELSRQEKNREALDVLEKLTANLELMQQPSFLFHLAVLRSKNSKHEAALDAVDRCVAVQKACATLTPIQEVMLAAFRGKDTCERASRYLIEHATDATVAQLEILAREHEKKWLRTAAFGVLKDGNYLDKLEKWSRYSILFVNSAKCKKRKEYLKKLKAEGDARALPALQLFSSRSGCGFLRLGDCYRCFRSDWQKTVSALQEEAAASDS
jgi:serine/threonine-protein kinase